VREYLEEKGYEVIPWHAQGVGDRTMDDEEPVGGGRLVTANSVNHKLFPLDHSPVA